MKILVVSLLRLGDLIQQGILLKQLRTQFPNARLHVLINKQFESSGPLFEGVVDRFHHFDRELYQRGLGEAGYNIFWSYHQLMSLIHELNGEEFDIVFNFTHNLLSAHLIGTLKAGEIRGLRHSQGQYLGIDSPWLRYFNDRFSGENKSVFHYVELLSRAFSIPVDHNPIQSSNSSQSRQILFQCLTSDKKKNWSLKKFAQLKSLLEQFDPTLEIKILAAPSDKEILLGTFSAKDVICCQLGEAQQLLKKAKLLVSLDTSIKHLAAQVGTPIVEICIGSSNARKTGAYTSNVKIVSTKVPCAPCSHSKACKQSSHLCDEDVTVESVLSAAKDILVGKNFNRLNLLDELDRATWSIYLNQKIPYNQIRDVSEAKDYLKSFSSNEVANFLPQWIENCHMFESWLFEIRRALPSKNFFVSAGTFDPKQLSELIVCARNILSSNKDVAGLFVAFIEALTMPFQSPAQLFERLSAAIEEIESLLSIRSILTSYLQTLSKEGVFYAKGIGQLSFVGAEEAGEGLRRDFKGANLQQGNRKD